MLYGTACGAATVTWSVSGRTVSAFRMSKTSFKISSPDTIAADVAAAVKSFQKWQAEKMGRDVNPSQLIALLMQTGVKRVEVRSPVFTTVADNAVAQIGTVSVVNGGAERE